MPEPRFPLPRLLLDTKRWAADLDQPRILAVALAITVRALAAPELEAGYGRASGEVVGDDVHLLRDPGEGLLVGGAEGIQDETAYGA